MIGKIGSVYNAVVPAALRPIAPVAEPAARGDFDQIIDQTGEALSPSSQRDTIGDDRSGQKNLPRQSQNAAASSASDAYSALTIDANEPQSAATGYSRTGQAANIAALNLPRGSRVDLTA
ncbi:hypothetical protein [uncultured Thalassospira sp.]|uniref:hypothetical protein n=1 Tax=uncultured Thalassospira sp. TaxID=404382 RepID=UPI0030DBCA51|tara:strand:+ start:9052 stop:9411 length:360 start_codon:yes stop_codon:yes gene_type:complete